MLVGLKTDLRHKKTCIDMLKTQGLTPVTTEQGKAVAKKMGAGYMECSSKEMKGVEEIFERAILTVVSNDRRNLEMQAASAGANASFSSSVGGAGGRTVGGVTYGGGGAGANFPGIGGLKKKKRKCVTF